MPRLLRPFGTALLAVALAGSGRADTTVPVTGIGTQVGAINTQVESVTYSEPESAQVAGFGEAYEVRGSVSGVGWGGAGIVARASNAHYNYRNSFVVRW